MPHKLPYYKFLETKRAAQVDRLANRLYPNDPERRKAFSEAILSGQRSAPALFWLTEKPKDPPFDSKKLAPWQPDWVDVLVHAKDRPALHPLYASGAYYPLDFSSVTMASPLLMIEPAKQTVLDVCSAPGGKAIFAWRHLKPQTLICNEVIDKRHRSLRGNLDRCHVPATVIKLDPKQLPPRYREQCDVVLVDAPCSGQSLIARGMDALGAFQDHLISADMTRQRRILSNSTECVTPGGYLLYSTCTYSKEENEKNVEWLLRTFSHFKTVEVPFLKSHQSTLIEAHCYRIEPQEGVGAGGFTALFRKEA